MLCETELAQDDLETFAERIAEFLAPSWGDSNWCIARHVAQSFDPLSEDVGEGLTEAVDAFFEASYEDETWREQLQADLRRETGWCYGIPAIPSALIADELLEKHQAVRWFQDFAMTW